MGDYIVCHKKRNAPRMNIRVCQKKCSLKEDCEEYLAYVKTPGTQKQVSVSAGSPAVAFASP